MSSISEYLKAEIIDPSLPRDSFVPPNWENDDDDEPDSTGLPNTDLRDDDYVE